MIITVTMNPAIDKTVDIDTLCRGGLNRIGRVELDAGGKGINVSKTIRHLGGSSVATGFLGGNAGRVIGEALSGYGIETDFVPVQGETRTNMKVVEADGTVTELNEPGPQVGEEDVRLLLEKLESRMEPGALVILSGSVPHGVSRDIYRVIIEKAHEKGASALLDADGELFARSVDAAPDIVKPNYMELAQYFQEEGELSEEKAAQLGYRLLEKGVGLAAISMGKDGALFLQKDRCWRCKGLSVKAHSTVGAGDAMVASLAWAWEQKLPMEETVRLAMAVSAGAVTTVGTKPPSKETVERLFGQVEVCERPF